MDDLVEFFKALADPSRLKVVGLLAHRPHSVEEMAEILDLRPSTVSHHMKKLTAAKLVRSRADGHYHLYELELDALHGMSKRLLSRGELQAIADDDAQSYDHRVLSTFLDEDGRLTAHPMKRRKFDVILRHALKLFEDGKEWSEKEVNRRLSALSDDVASLRRGFIDHGYMTRDPSGARYVLTSGPVDRPTEAGR